MIKIKLENGLVYTARDYDSLIEQMFKFVHVHEEGVDTVEKFKKGIARRCKIFDGKGIKYNSNESFIKELKRVGVIVNLDENYSNVVQFKRGE